MPTTYKSCNFLLIGHDKNEDEGGQSDEDPNDDEGNSFKKPGKSKFGNDHLLVSCYVSHENCDCKIKSETQMVLQSTLAKQTLG